MGDIAVARSVRFTKSPLTCKPFQKTLSSAGHSIVLFTVHSCVLV